MLSLIHIWCKPGYTGLYNIYMMEELHSILSLGGGGMNEINLPEEKLARYHNPVSYTHLDVYKRQHQGRAPEECAP